MDADAAAVCDVCVSCCGGSGCGELWDVDGVAVGIAVVGVGVCCACLFACLFGIKVTVGRSVLADSCTVVRAGGGGIDVGCVGSLIGIAGAFVSTGLDVAGLVLDLCSLEHRIW